MTSVGLFGKLPGHGDFVQRQLSGNFVNFWDQWLQRAVHGSRELMGEAWLDYYLTSPIWRFALSAGVVDQFAWAGILVPSVDSVGRYFPVTIAAPLSAGASPFAVQQDANEWYQQLSTLAIDALQGGMQADDVMSQLPAVPTITLATSEQVNPDAIRVTGGNDCSIVGSYPGLLDHLYRQQYASFSLWWCGGSQYLEPTTLACAGLPEPEIYCSMLGGQSLQW